MLQYTHPMHVSTYDFLNSPMSIGRSMVQNMAPAALTWVANTSIFIPMYLPWPYPVNRVWWVNGSTASSNINLGIFQKSGKLIYETGSTAQAGANVAQYVTPSTTFVLGKGHYYFALSCDSTTNRLSGTAGFTTVMLRHMGVLEQTSNFALADPATLATAANALYWYGGVTRTQSGH